MTDLDERLAALRKKWGDDSIQYFVEHEGRRYVFRGDPGWLDTCYRIRKDGTLGAKLKPGDTVARILDSLRAQNPDYAARSRREHREALARVRPLRRPDPGKAS